MLEFTGERMIPGMVDAALLNEHMARYRFAAGFCGGADVLDAGCGSGYGSAEFIEARSVTSFDFSGEAVAYAREHYSRPSVRFLQAACETMPFADSSFDLITAFELIEHIEHWPELLAEARRVLRPGGVLLISTPNKSYYAETRAAVGPNPYHVREFESAEFEEALTAVFPHVRLWSQNTVEAVVFAPRSTANGRLDATRDDDPANAHFFVAACSAAPLAEPRAFGWIPSAGNLLREREHHIELLRAELARKDEWLENLKGDLSRLNLEHTDLLAEVERSNQWAAKLDADVKAAAAEIVRVHAELDQAHASYSQRISAQEAEAAERLEWVRQLDAQIADLSDQTARARGELDRLNRLNSEKDVAVGSAHERIEFLEKQSAERLTESERLAEESRALAEQLLASNEHARILAAHLTTIRDGVARSRWVRLGRTLGIGPEVTTDPMANGSPGVGGE